MLLISLNFLHSPSTFSVCSIVSDNVKKMYNVWRTTVILIVTMYTEFVLYYTMLIVLNKFNSIQFKKPAAAHPKKRGTGHSRSRTAG